MTRTPLLLTAISFPKSSRILKSSEFSAIQKRCKRLHSKNFSALVATAKESDKKHSDKPARLGITISKKSEKLAVKRNRIKRVIREAFRHLQQHCPLNLRLVIVAKSSCANLSAGEFREELTSLLKSQKILSADAA